METIGFVPEPSCGRGTVSIVWSCLATIFFVVWTVLHMDYRDGISRVIWGASTFLMPEAMPGAAIQQLVLARRLQRRLNQIRGWGSWSLEQSFLVVKNGVHDKGSGEVLTADRLVELAGRGGHIHMGMFPHKGTIGRRSKKGGFEKMVAGGQVLWFSANMASRLLGRYQVTLLEDMTMAYACCGLIAMAAWFRCPQDIEEPFEVDLRGLGASEKESGEMHHCTFGIVGNSCLSGLVVPGVLMVTAVHLGAWQYPFPTVVEAWVWRSCALATVPLGFLLPHFRKRSLFLVSGTGIVVARLALWTVACIALRRMPVSAFDTPKWSDYWGHIGK